MRVCGRLSLQKKTEVGLSISKIIKTLSSTPDLACSRSQIWQQRCLDWSTCFAPSVKSNLSLGARQARHRLQRLSFCSRLSSATTFGYDGLSSTLITRGHGCEIFHLPLRSPTMSFSYGNNCRGCLRLENRRQRDYFQVGRVHQLDAKKLSLADANGPGLLCD